MRSVRNFFGSGKKDKEGKGKEYMKHFIDTPFEDLPDRQRSVRIDESQLPPEYRNADSKRRYPKGPATVAGIENHGNDVHDHRDEQRNHHIKYSMQDLRIRRDHAYDNLRSSRRKEQPSSGYSSKKPSSAGHCPLFAPELLEESYKEQETDIIREVADWISKHESNIQRIPKVIIKLNKAEEKVYQLSKQYTLLSQQYTLLSKQMCSVLDANAELKKRNEKMLERIEHLELAKIQNSMAPSSSENSSFPISSSSTMPYKNGFAYPNLKNSSNLMAERKFYHQESTSFPAFPLNYRTVSACSSNPSSPVELEPEYHSTPSYLNRLQIDVGDDEEEEIEIPRDSQITHSTSSLPLQSQKDALVLQNASFRSGPELLKSRSCEWI